VVAGTRVEEQIMKLDGTRAPGAAEQAMNVDFGITGACDDCLPARCPARVEVRFEADSHPDQVVSLCTECLIARLADGEHIAQLLICDEVPIALHQIAREW
jgi:hypothetical protein